jgi:hypothetical protein
MVETLARLGRWAPRRSFRSVMLAVPCALFLANVFGGISLASQSRSEEAPCLKRHHLPAFTAYDLGRTFDGLPLTSVERSCFAPPAGKHRLGEPASVAWTSDAIYGTCTPEGSEGTCDDPLEIDSYPECDHNFSSYGVVEPAGALHPRKSFFLSGSSKIPHCRTGIWAFRDAARDVRGSNDRRDRFLREPRPSEPREASGSRARATDCTQALGHIGRQAACPRR